MSYNMKLENFLDLQIYKQHQKRAALLYCAVLSNKLQCHITNVISVTINQVNSSADSSRSSVSLNLASTIYRSRRHEFLRILKW